MISPTSYYYLTNSKQLKLLTVQPKLGTKNHQITFQSMNDESLSQLWMLKSADLEDVYYLSHPLLGLVLEVGNESKLTLNQLKNKNSQKFKLHLISTQDQQYTITQFQKGAALMIKTDKIVCEREVGEAQTNWILKPAQKHRMLQESAIIQYQNSGYVLEVGQNPEKEGSLLQQGDWEGMLTQTWIVHRIKEFYVLRNLRSGLVATVKGGKGKQGIEIVQQPQHENQHKNQLWSLEPRGYRIYSIRLASERELFLGVKTYIKDKSPVCLMIQSYRHHWRIVSNRSID